ncbi:hypothetical protein PVAP13_2NG331615 [Panicum virgatum]|uniref:Alcohol dehydrogenase-like N-terminal domain-containing protein n=1 Tax=Panicum virgatum TaxID=38727 RepID=A0A8T0VTE1_PANVG|nr:hypothetical protein PVAP13_2NG331615 [Panicum virgatum]
MATSRSRRGLRARRRGPGCGRWARRRRPRWRPEAKITRRSPRRCCRRGEGCGRRQAHVPIIRGAISAPAGPSSPPPAIDATPPRDQSPPSCHPGRPRRTSTALWWSAAGAWRAPPSPSLPLDVAPPRPRRTLASSPPASAGRGRSRGRARSRRCVAWLRAGAEAEARRLRRGEDPKKRSYRKEQATAASKRTKAVGGRKMRPVVITRGGGPEVLEAQDVEDPAPLGKGEVLLQVAAAGVIRSDTLQRHGHRPPPAGASPYPGLECSGTILALGPNMPSRWSIGDKGT